MESIQDTPEVIELRKRWARWLAGVCRKDRHGYMTLLDGTWKRWASVVMGEENTFLPFTASREEVKEYYQEAINRATRKQFGLLDSIYVSEKAKTR